MGKLKNINMNEILLTIAGILFIYSIASLILDLFEDSVDDDELD